MWLVAVGWLSGWLLEVAFWADRSTVGGDVCSLEPLLGRSRGANVCECAFTRVTVWKDCPPGVCVAGHSPHFLRVPTSLWASVPPSPWKSMATVKVRGRQAARPLAGPFPVLQEGAPGPSLTVHLAFPPAACPCASG